MAKNKIKSKAKEKENEYQSEIAVKPSKKKKNGNVDWMQFIHNEKFIRISGIFCILFSVFLLVAFVSFFFAWWVDFDKMSNANVGELIFNTHISVGNWGGRLGALLSYFFIEKLFGIASFGFVLIFFVFGFHLLKIELLPFKKVFVHTIIWMMWLSVCLGYVSSFFVSNQYNIPAGIFGFETSNWISGFIGRIGTGFFLFFSLLTFLILAYNYKLKLKFLLKIGGYRPSDGSSTKKGIEEEGEELTIGTENERKNFLVNEDRPHSIIAREEEVLSEEEEEASLDFQVISQPKQQNDSENKKLEFSINSYAEPQKETNLSKDAEIDFSIEENPESENGIGDRGEQEKINEQEIVHYSVDEPYDPHLDLGNYEYPSLDSLIYYEERNQEVTADELHSNKDKIVETLKNYSIEIVKIVASPGPTVTLYEIVPAPGIRISKIKNLEDDIALSLSALGIRIIAPIPGKGTIGIEVPNLKPQIVSMKTMLSSDKFANSKFELPVAIGKTISNEPFVADLAKMPHLLMAGATGQGKSVGLNAIISSLLYKKHPSELKFVMVDPKKVELSLYAKIERHYLAKLPDSEEAIITDTRKVVRTLNSLCIEMDQRYDLLKDAQVRNIKEYNAKFIARRLNPNDGHRYLPYIVLVVDEFADLIMTAGKEVELPIARLAQLARAIGIHLIIATQRPSVNIITGTIKANFPARIAFRVTSKIDSRTILDASGAEQLIGRGDMLLSLGSELIRLQCALIDTEEIEQVATFIGSQRGYPETFLLPEYLDENSEPSKEFDPNQRDDKFEEAARIVVAHQHGSTSLLQRKLQLGYNRAGRLIDQLEAAGIVGPFEGSKAREVKIKSEIELEELLRSQLRD